MEGILATSAERHGESEHERDILHCLFSCFDLSKVSGRQATCAAYPPGLNYLPGQVETHPAREHEAPRITVSMIHRANTATRTEKQLGRRRHTHDGAGAEDVGLPVHGSIRLARNRIGRVAIRDLEAEHTRRGEDPHGTLGDEGGIGLEVRPYSHRQPELNFLSQLEPGADKNRLQVKVARRAEEALDKRIDVGIHPEP